MIKKKYLRDSGYWYVYIVSFKDIWMIKVGATKNMDNRVQQLKMEHKNLWEMKVEFLCWCYFYYQVEWRVKEKYLWNYMALREMTEFINIEYINKVKKYISKLSYDYDKCYNDNYVKQYTVRYKEYKKSSYWVFYNWKLVSKFNKPSQLFFATNFNQSEIQSLMNWESVWWYTVNLLYF